LAQPPPKKKKKKEKRKKAKPIKRKSFVARCYKSWKEKEPHSPCNISCSPMVGMYTLS
jgi:hypothetical protein